MLAFYGRAMLSAQLFAEVLKELAVLGSLEEQGSALDDGEEAWQRAWDSLDESTPTGSVVRARG